MELFGYTLSPPPTLYQYYTENGIDRGLTAENGKFQLNNKDITIYGGSLHYFRVPQQYWRTELRKLRAAGLNAVDTYVPWNLHEYQNGSYDFGNGGSDMQDFLDVKTFVKTAQEEDLFVVMRAGPYICAEWEYGGLPSWLLREDGIKVRTSDNKFMKYVERYFNILLPILALLQFTQGGPIIAFQVENEYGTTVNSTPAVDDLYMQMLKNIFIHNGINELLFTSNNVIPYGQFGNLPNYLQMANFQRQPYFNLLTLNYYQPKNASMVMELWAGWFDYWGGTHETTNILTPIGFACILRRILSFRASVNIYMFRGGTNWGFLNGGNYNLKDMAAESTDNTGFNAITTSYDYRAPITEFGYYTRKYLVMRDVIKIFNRVETKLPDVPDVNPLGAYKTVDMTQQLTMRELEEQLPKIPSVSLIPMEQLPINNNSGQSFGYIIYQKTNINIPANSFLMISGRVCDTVIVLVNGVRVSPDLRTAFDLNNKFGTWALKDSILSLGSTAALNATLDLIVENWGRNNVGKLPQFVQFKGLWQGPVYINDQAITDWNIYPLEFKTKWTNSLTGWHAIDNNNRNSPAVFRGTFTVDQPIDTFVDMRQWTKGIVIINGFVLGRYANMGPQQTLYLPAPLVKQGENTLIVFEHYVPASSVPFVDRPIYNSTVASIIGMYSFWN